MTDFCWSNVGLIRIAVEPLHCGMSVELHLCAPAIWKTSSHEKSWLNIESRQDCMLDSYYLVHSSIQITTFYCNSQCPSLWFLCTFGTQSDSKSCYISCWLCTSGDELGFLLPRPNIFTLSVGLVMACSTLSRTMGILIPLSVHIYEKM